MNCNKGLLVILTVVFGAVSFFAYAGNVPKFKDYPARIYAGEEMPVRIDTDEARQYEANLRTAARKDTNFAGRYVLTTWSAGMGCMSGAAIDISTGIIHFLPFASCDRANTDQPFYFRPSSRLLVVSGKVGEVGEGGAHFFEFDGTQFKPVGLISRKTSTSENVEPSAGPVTSGDRINTVAGRIEAVRADPQVGPILGCYDKALQAGMSAIFDRSADEKQYDVNVMLAGGISRIGNDVLMTCNKWYLENPKITGDKSSTIAPLGKVFMFHVMEQERLFVQECVSHDADPAWQDVVKLCKKLEIN